MMDKYGPIGNHTVISALNPAVTLTLPVGTDAIAVQSRTADVYYTMNGTTPSPTVGFLLPITSNGTTIPVARGTVLKFYSATGEIQYQPLQIVGTEG